MNHVCMAALERGSPGHFYYACKDLSGDLSVWLALSVRVWLSQMPSVSDALASMQDLIQRGQMTEAKAVGLTAVFPGSGLACPLSIPLAEIKLGSRLSAGSEGDVYAAELASGEKVAVKKLRWVMDARMTS